jgi:hypothetical protein
MLPPLLFAMLVPPLPFEPLLLSIGAGFHTESLIRGGHEQGAGTFAVPALSQFREVLSNPSQCLVNGNLHRRRLERPLRIPTNLYPTVHNVLQPEKHPYSRELIF